ncbi:MAG: hypothetical protein IPI24_02585 [Ignavibacteria bacterium]|nr:hypothetical protein [Ignavibacteria bacterium]MBK6418829.1 hypothetical protein [Ignavibacteria bacterium]MBK6760482.1 hypothetical protein [Ignavibacteria bacterium]MBK7411735.1 hypothetical protein [Ignavibacteria bacterium]MBK7576302.1 hypothetical protein [Ignavibacteria bacterium]
MTQEYISFRKWPADHAQEAYEAGFYIETLQVLHGWIEVKLRELLHLQRAGRFKKTTDEELARSWNMSNELSLSMIAKALFVAGELSEGTLDQVLQFNRTRNNIVHKLFYDPYNKEYLGVPKEEYDRAYRDGVELGYVIENLSARRIE